MKSILRILTVLALAISPALADAKIKAGSIKTKQIGIAVEHIHFTDSSSGNIPFQRFQILVMP